MDWVAVGGLMANTFFLVFASVLIIEVLSGVRAAVG
jgi:hypothetical protein